MKSISITNKRSFIAAKFEVDFEYHEPDSLRHHTDQVDIYYNLPSRGSGDVAVPGHLLGFHSLTTSESFSFS